MKAEVLNWENKKVGDIELSSDVFESEVRKDVLHTVVKWQLACRRQGTHKAKTRGEVSGGGKKPFKQKGTGNARQGSTRSPLREGGGVIHGPSPRDYSYTVPKKIKQLGLRSALSYLYKNNKLKIVESVSSDDGKTKNFVNKVNGLGVQKAVIVDSNKNDMCLRASRNIQSLCYQPVGGVNVYDLLKYDFAIVSKECVEALQDRCGVKS